MRSYRTRPLSATTLLRRTYRANGNVKQQTLANLSALPPDAIAILRAILRGATFVPLDHGMEVVRSVRHGDVACALATAKRLGLADILDPTPSRMRALALAMYTLSPRRLRTSATCPAAP